MTTANARAARYEVEADFIQLKSPEGHRHWFRRGSELPGWVPAEKVAELLESGAVFKYEVI